MVINKSRAILRTAVWAIVVIIAGFIVLVCLVTHPIVWYQRQASSITIEPTLIEADVRVLSNLSLARTFDTFDSLRAAADYISASFMTTGCTVTRQPFAVAGREYANIICSFAEEYQERVIVGAHYDVVPHTPGADDNASGVAGLLALARVMGKEQPLLRHRVDLVAYALEEQPFFNTDAMGSMVHARYLKNHEVTVHGVLVFEMIGYFSTAPRSQQYPFRILDLLYPSTGNFIAVIGPFTSQGFVGSVKRQMLEHATVDVRSMNAPIGMPDVDRSDHQSYWRAGYDAVMITDTSSFRNPHYHLESDTIDTLDFEKISEVVRGVYHAVVNL